MGAGMTRRRSQGFTLLELMVSISIITVLLLLARPGMGGWQMSSRQYELTLDVANMGRRAASRARETGSAHTLRLTTVSGQFNLEVLQGMTRKCRQTFWDTAEVGVPFMPDTGRYDVHNRLAETEKLEITFTTYTSQGAQWLTALDLIDICYEPSGKTYWISQPMPGLVLQTGMIEAIITRSGGSAQRTRIVSFPPAGTPRPRL